jgi:hypothetical protein
VPPLPDDEQYVDHGYGIEDDQDDAAREIAALHIVPRE